MFPQPLEKPLLPNGSTVYLSILYLIFFLYWIIVAGNSRVAAGGSQSEELAQGSSTGCPRRVRTNYQSALFSSHASPFPDPTSLCFFLRSVSFFLDFEQAVRINEFTFFKWRGSRTRGVITREPFVPRRNETPGAVVAFLLARLCCSQGFSSYSTLHLNKESRHSRTLQSL